MLCILVWNVEINSIIDEYIKRREIGFIDYIKL